MLAKITRGVRPSAIGERPSVKGLTWIGAEGVDTEFNGRMAKDGQGD